MEWISIRTSTPKEFENVLLFDLEKGLLLGYYSKSATTFIQYIDGSPLNEVSRWMPIPGNPIDDILIKNNKVKTVTWKKSKAERMLW